MHQRDENFNQNFWHLTCIQTASLGLPGIVLTSSLIKIYGADVIPVSVGFSVIILWLIGFAIVSMSYKHGYNAIENAAFYTGKPLALMISLISVIGFPIWYADQLWLTTNAIDGIICGPAKASPLSTGLYTILIGMLIAIVSLWKPMRTIRQLNVFLLAVVDMLLHL